MQLRLFYPGRTDRTLAKEKEVFRSKFDTNISRPSQPSYLTDIVFLLGREIVSSVCFVPPFSRRRRLLLVLRNRRGRKKWRNSILGAGKHACFSIEAMGKLKIWYIERRGGVWECCVSWLDYLFLYYVFRTVRSGLGQPARGCAFWKKST